jgi:hypothetical protein
MAMRYFVTSAAVIALFPFFVPSGAEEPSVSGSFGCVRLGHAEMEVKFDNDTVGSAALYNDVDPQSPYYWIASPR